MKIVIIKKPNNKNCLAILEEKELYSLVKDQEYKESEQQYIFRTANCDLIFDVMDPSKTGFVEDLTLKQIGPEFDLLFNARNSELMDFNQTTDDVLAEGEDKKVFFIQWENRSYSIIVCSNTALEKNISTIRKMRFTAVKEFNFNMFFSLHKSEWFGSYVLDFDGIFERGVVFEPKNVCKLTGYSMNSHRFIKEMYEEKITLGKLSEYDFSFQEKDVLHNIKKIESNASK